MKKYSRVFCGVMAMLLTLLAGMQMTNAAEYTYTLTFSPGEQGSFASADSVKVNNHKTQSAYQIAVEDGKIKITGLKAGDIVSCDAPSVVTLSDNGKYYVKGIRLSGRDNNTVAKSAFVVDSDQDYVVAYGIPGDLTEYTVNYIDESGKKLADSQTYYGNVGDEPVIAYRYIDGYIPTAYNQTRVLVADKNENVFDFIYKVGTEEAQNTQGGSATGEGEETFGETTIVDSDSPDNHNVEADNKNDTNNGNNTGAGNGADQGDSLGINENADALTQIEDGNVPLGQRAANAVKKAADNGALAPIVVGFVSVLALAVLGIFAISGHRRRKGY